MALVGGGLLTVGGALLRQSARIPAWGRGLAWAAGIVLICVFWTDTAREFVYFQF